MTPQQESLYYEMMIAITRAQDCGMAAAVDPCYWIAKEYWEKVKEFTNKEDLKSDITAIEFFRDTKPQFTSQIQYFTMISEVLIFVPEHSDEQNLYWSRELKRYNRFYSKNSEFIDYYETGERHMDKTYFVLTKPGTITEKRMHYDDDINYCSPKDHLVRSILAQKQYRAFVHEQLNRIPV